MLFRPTYVFNRVTEITPEFLEKNGIKALLLDLDNTLTTHNNPVPPKENLKWIEDMKNSGIKLMIVSNNSVERVTPFAKQLGLPFTARGMKPLTYGFTTAMKKLGTDKKNTAAVGDQIFTDVLGANLKGISSVFVYPIEPEKSLPFRFKRVIERPFLPKK